jgi:thiol-disulfide isomerase/thioredoxin
MNRGLFPVGVNALKRFWSRLLVIVVSLILLAAISVFGFFKWAERRVASRLQPPTLHLESLTVPDLPFHSLDGKLRHVSELKGKVVFLDLWGTWCIQCIAEMPTVQKLYDHYRNDPDVEFLIVSRLDSPSAVRAYASRHHFDLPFYVTRDEDVPDSMYLHQYPATFLYARDGSIVAQHAAAADWDDPSVIEFIDRLKQQ